MRQSICAILFAMWAWSAWSAAPTCNGHLIHGIPSQSDQLLCRTGYALGYNYSRKTADWVAYRLTPDIHDDGNVDRQNDFRVDTELPAIYQTTPADYVEPVFDQGHLANSESLDDTITMNSETFLMSNMTPQLPGLNSAGWKGLENRERKWTDNRGELFIYAGPLFEGGLPSFIGNGVPVPTHFWKVIYDPAAQEAIAFIFPHRRVLTSELSLLLVSVNEVEIRSGLNFLTALADTTEETIEQSQPLTQWTGLDFPSAPVSVVLDTRPHSQACCKICRAGKACGNSCISRSNQCHQSSGCACDG